ncbi:MAG: co-chaperone YbbN [Paracoccus sp. (in: a-proteobacteria)]|uniref:thioredoxin family protein n=1 Tax=Paracoccus sp. TaxID=267 RepID=UPI0026E0859D|nr:co-chaperone YbbN [Paracoccus sp. (in: a-proteobacteria)]MDO5612626.1 co-chaperone YbbN [Paracoccus sp. (in: a-proteobacteria)]
MLNLGSAPESAPAAADLILDVTEANFMAEVIDRSMEVPVIVDLWAPWCGPCKTLGPLLEAEVLRLKGRVRMVKVDVDQNQMIAAQLRVQSVPTVYAFYQGRPVDAFQGALPASEVRAFVEKLAGLAGDGGLGEALEAAETMLAEGAAEDAAETFAAITDEAPDNAEAWGGLIRAHLAMGDEAGAEAALARVPDKVSGLAPVEAARAQLALTRQAASAGPLADLEARVTASPDDQQARLDYAGALHAAGRVDEAIDILLDSFRRDRDWNDGAAKAQLLTIFDSLKPNDPLVQRGRRRLSSIIFA